VPVGARDGGQTGDQPATGWISQHAVPLHTVDAAGSYMTGGTLAQWFDVIVHRQVVTPTHPAAGE
jgi:hypothetical protein